MEDIEMYKKMLEIRKFEEKVYDLFTQNLIPGTMHLYMGEEAVAVGVCAALTPNDFITSTHRGHGHCIAKGASLKKMMAEIFGKKTGYCKGKGGSMHITDKNIGMLGANAVVGGAIPIAVGAGLSCKLKYPERVTVCFFGDGASNQGTFHEGINMASVWDLPVIFVCENNLYAMGTRQSLVMNIEDISERAAGYGIPGATVDGNDVMAVYQEAQRAVTRARNGDGPTLIECKTYRHKGHSRFDPAKYRPQEEVAEWMARDPIESFRYKLLDKGIPEEFLHKIESTVETEIEEAVEFAEESPLPEPEDALKDVWVVE
ncbi:MAG: pyruvate dehydrogenase (acetyl-transferring) E1 component subunit alpha [Theionarchaea archaeon]|nr:pyruvate dehydrogenase (acetyl-transferring) E1 component subunit alpha [Theionarchaea archaeon]MBU7001993.1 pyruvate dehydrogenase (acetyl-transferring) E1 component subunit alpha [Theionarchaea archaeon]MBU7019756.1 pyruvate dehydrogenase (acetyl-transferring) E1 component subunit alpha [Theionarchaea archaeon]MBU7034624.1 pyruvate dehydrogenase (acetyl-transferring) E1 component subunit alpha [Theionarchaea archaeon]MBU7040619.1 pyruvate dehydrogenase (acetyl-transferring) E1 component su